MSRKGKFIGWIFVFGLVVYFIIGTVAIWHYFPWMFSGPPSSARGVAWIVAIVLLVPLFIVFITPIFAMSGWRKYLMLKRARNGCCGHCGYDLRASKDRCPECGEMTPLYGPHQKSK